MLTKLYVNRLLFSALLVALTPVAAQAQRNTVGTQGPSVSVQLPTFQYFGTSTTVLVPDRGGAYNGGINRSSYNSRSRGVPLFPWANRAISRGAAAANTSTHAWIHDHQAMDEALLQQAAQRRGASEPSLTLNGDEVPDADPVLVSAKEFERRQSAAQDKLQAEAMQHLAKAKSMLAEGKPGVAKIYFQMAYRRAEGSLKAEIAAEMKELRGANIASGK